VKRGIDIEDVRDGLEEQFQRSFGAESPAAEDELPRGGQPQLGAKTRDVGNPGVCRHAVSPSKQNFRLNGEKPEDQAVLEELQGRDLTEFKESTAQRQMHPASRL
jgi:hypothetical protein